MGHDIRRWFVGLGPHDPKSRNCSGNVANLQRSYYGQHAKQTGPNAVTASNTDSKGAKRTHGNRRH